MMTDPTMPQAPLEGGDDRVRRLGDMHEGQQGLVVSVKGRGAHSRRLRDMGIVPGSRIRIEGEAPLGDPIEIKVLGYNLTLRRAEAANILVEVDA